MNDHTGDHHARIRDQYSESVGKAFYRCVMGDGCPSIHYGLYASDATSMRAAIAAANAGLLDIAVRIMGNDPCRDVLDLGAGPGGSAHFVAARTGAHVTCVDLCEHHHRENLDTARRLGLADQVSIWHGPFERLPASWSGRFDLLWSQEALCHARGVMEVLVECHRVLRPGGAMVFSDILLATDAGHDRASAFRQVNAVTECRTEEEYRRMLAAAGFTGIAFKDWSDHLPANFRRMRARIETHRDALTDAGVPRELIDRFAASLDERLYWKPGEVLRWGAFAAVKPGAC